MATLSLFFDKAQWQVKQALGLMPSAQNQSKGLVWEGSCEEDVSCCRVVWVLKD